MNSKRRIASLDKEFLHPSVGVVEEEIACRRFAVTSGASGFLVIRLDASRHIEMHDEPDVRPIDTHSKRIRGHDNIAPALHEFVLRFLPLLVTHPAVVKNARDVRQLQRLGHGFDSFAGRAINNAGFVFPDKRVQPLVFFRFIGDRRDQQLQVRTRKSGHEFPRLAQSEMSENIAAHFRGGSGRERRHLRTAQSFEDLAEPKIIGTKIVAPHRETMRLVDREQRDRALTQCFEERTTSETFRGDVNQLEFPATQRANPLLLFARTERTVDQRCRNSPALERVDLVFHERDQGAKRRPSFPPAKARAVDNRAIFRRPLA